MEHVNLKSMNFSHSNAEIVWTNETILAVQNVERNLAEVITMKIDTVFDTVENTIQGAFLATLNSISAPKFNWALGQQMYLQDVILLVLLLFPNV